MRRCLLLPAIWFLSTQRTSAFTQRSWDESVRLANETVSQMTLDEKVGIVTGVGIFSSRCSGDTTAPNRTFSVSGLNVTVPALCLADGPAGLRSAKNVTGFPAGINIASTFSRRLMHARGVAIGEEFRAKGVHLWLGPAMDIFRNPRGGRGWERRVPATGIYVLTNIIIDSRCSFGADPYLSGEAAYETVAGAQSVGVQAVAKHYIVNNQETSRHTLNAVVGDRTLHEIYHYPYMRAIDANISSIMCSYNRINGTYSCQDANLYGPDGVVTKAGFQGFILSDWGAAQGSTNDSVNAGLDMEQPGGPLLNGGGVYGVNLTTAVNDGVVQESKVDGMVTRILASWFRLGQDQDYPAVSIDTQHPDGTGPLNIPIDARSAQHTSLVRKIGAASVVLLKNERNTEDGNTVHGLPLSESKIKSLAIIGRDAKQLNQSCGSLGQCDEGTMVIGWGSGSNNLDFVVPPVDAIQSHIGDSANVTTSLSNDPSDGSEAAEGKDAALVFVNAMSGEEIPFGEPLEGVFGDRLDLDLWFKGAELIESVAAVNPNTIVVVHSVGPVNASWSTHPNISAIVYAGAPGEQSGPAIVDILWGAVNPSGRLPFSMDDVEYTEGLFIDYRYMDSKGIKPRYEFGFGLSYTTFEYSDLLISPSGDSQVVEFKVKNTGDFDGTEIPQLYLGYPEGSGEPPRVMRGFDDVCLAMGETKTVKFLLGQRELSIWDTPSQSWKRPEGTFKVEVGASIQDTRLTGSF
ncbi:hypothetical protein V5O48_008988 [Marasmius crinis-equi]|uniref:beta-glucosidase n=1 Tax=Marasmius crinis-equi TaxID=585013 RepID=A0ABR3FCH1_9AGAR